MKERERSALEIGKNTKGKKKNGRER